MDGIPLCSFGQGEYRRDYTPPGRKTEPPRSVGVPGSRGAFRVERKDGWLSRWVEAHPGLARYPAERMAEEGALVQGGRWAVVCTDASLPFDRRVEFYPTAKGVVKVVIEAGKAGVGGTGLGGTVEVYG